MPPSGSAYAQPRSASPLRWPVLYLALTLILVAAIMLAEVLI